MIAVSALFFALGGSALAISDAVRPQPRCAIGAVLGIASVTGGSGGAANVGDTFTSRKDLFTRQFNCGSGPPQVRRVAVGVYEVRFPGNGSGTALSSSPTTHTNVQPLGGGVFRVSLWVPGRQDAIDASFTVVVV